MIDTDNTRDARLRMVHEQIAMRGVRDAAVLEAMAKVPRHLFVPLEVQAMAYEDRPLPIGEGQTISQPYIVAYMTQCLQLQPGARVLEVGTGSGYQTAVLSQVAAKVYSVENRSALLERARELLEALGVRNVCYRLGDGNEGWPEEAPFDAILAACAAPRVPQALIDQLAPGGVLVIPVGSAQQQLLRLHKDAGGEVHQEPLTQVRFVPLTHGVH